MTDRLIPKIPIEQAVGLTASWIGSEWEKRTSKRRAKREAELAKQREYYKLVADLQLAKRGK